MRIFNIHEAKTHLSRLVEEAAQGKAFIIARAGKPLVKVMALETPTGARVRRLGFMQGNIKVPRDFNRMGKKEIERLFELAREAVAGYPIAALGRRLSGPIVRRMQKAR